MNERIRIADVERRHPLTPRAQSRRRSALADRLPLAVAGLAIAWLLIANPLASFDNGAPPVENLTFERTILDQDGIRAAGPRRRLGADDRSPRCRSTTPTGSSRRTRRDRSRAATPRGSACPIPGCSARRTRSTFVTNTGATFEHEIAVAVPTPTRDRRSLRLAGAARRLRRHRAGRHRPAVLSRRCAASGRDGMNFLLALTVGLLAFLFVDTLEEALELAGEVRRAVPGAGDGGACRGGELPAADRGRPPRAARRPGWRSPPIIALGIGLHNLGEGLAIGAAFAAGAAGLGTFLVLGFTLHNVTEGIGIAAPILKVTAAAVDLRRRWRCWPAARRSSACGSAASPMRRTGRRWRWRSAPARSCRSSSRSAPI